MARVAFRVVAASVVLATFACGDSTGSGKAFTARFLNGAQHAAAAGSASRVFPSPAIGQNAQANAAWLLTPDKTTLTVISLALRDATGKGDATTVNCSVTYDVTKTGLSLLDACPFTVSLGTYTQVEVGFNASISVLVNDAVNNFYSTATGIVSAAPAGGATTYTYAHVGNDVTNGTFTVVGTLATPIVISDTSTLNNVNIVVNGAQYLALSVNNGNITIGGGSGGASDPGRPDLIVTAGAPAGVEVYAVKALGTNGTYCAGDIGCPLIDGFKTVSIYYSAAGVASIASVNPGSAPCTMKGPTFMNNPKAYVGLDATGVLGWANGAGGFSGGNGPDTTYNHYSALFRMARRTTLGDTTTLFCTNTQTDPAPSGGSFASGAPNIATAGNAVGTYVLVAH